MCVAGCGVLCCVDFTLAPFDITVRFTFAYIQEIYRDAFEIKLPYLIIFIPCEFSLRASC